MPHDIERPYGPLIESTARVAAWNVWDRYGPWEDREKAILAVLREAAPDAVVLVEAWEDDDAAQAARLGGALGLPHTVFRGGESRAPAGGRSGIALLSRWPLGRVGERRLGDRTGADGGLAVHARVDGPRGALQLFGAALGWKLGHSAQRQEQVRALGAYVRETTGRDAPVVVAGDFNADPDSDEIRMLTGRAAVSAPGVVFYDAWETAGDGTPGYTWSGANPWTEPVLWPDRRIDYVFSAWPRAGGAGHPVRCGLLGDRPVDGVVPSDHYGVFADLRY
ncbi:endonuclease/exonuclease/phosphatase family protein [Actinomadura darangshiensis]|uniref:Endonuclease/exonuclease/phosphatase family protein n=1 Tax=Actinomadura darangshiensis TaxID=705336 RepID=A0A4R5BP14_9ACTN|nr:endonuclease/exonuclease/phosphatase family protein [Actinomadura darangshiensis]TDD85732.1 endonuclease/exonuclease/phosphatase family protein [Actinomadura darangshiensis]